MHFNARMYDPAQGRFLQPDPVIQSPDNAQSWNPYSYCLNNPLTYTDPTGAISTGLRQFLGLVIAVVGTIVCQGMDGGFWARLGMAVAFGAAAGGVATGTWQGALYGAFSAALTFGVGWAANTYQWNALQTIGAQAAAGGITEYVQGGNFGNGFIAAGLTAAAMPGLQGRAMPTRVVVGALIGGTISEMTGGKFANGAVSGAIQGAMAGSDERDLPESDRELAGIAQDSYDPQRALSSQQLEALGLDPNMFVNSDTGFSASMYQLKNGYAVAFRGSDSLLDWYGTNIPQALGLRVGQYSQAVALARTVVATVGGNVVFTGHSLGGGLASVAGLATGRRAVTFNAAGVSRSTLRHLGISSRDASQLITSYKSASDILSVGQALTPLPNALGQSVWYGPAGHHGIGGVCKEISCL
jgi:hypothetical protein